MDWFKGNLNRKPWFLPSNIGVSGSNFPIIQFYDFQGSKKCQAPWCLDGVAHELLGVQDEALPDPAGDIRPKRRAVSGDVKNRDFDWDMGPPKKTCYTTYITYNLFIYIYVYIECYRFDCN